MRSQKRYSRQTSMRMRLHHSRFKSSLCFGLTMLQAALLPAACGPAFGQAKKPAPAAATGSQQAGELFQAGSKAYAAGDLKSAHADFAKLVRVAPRVGAAHSALGVVLLAEGDVRGAIAELSIAHKLTPADARTSISLGMAYSRLGDYSHAAEVFDSVPPPSLADLSSEEAIAYGGAMAATGKLPEALSELAAAHAAEPGNAALLDALGSVQAQTGNMAAAEQSFRGALAVDGKLASAHAHLGSAMLARGNASAAVAELPEE